MEEDRKKRVFYACCRDDVQGFAVAINGLDINTSLLWTGRKMGISGIHSIQRTPLMLCALDCWFLYEPSAPEIYDMLIENNANYHEPLNPGGLIPRSDYLKVETKEDDPQLLGWRYETDYFMLYLYKARPCTSGSLCHRQHDCPFSHPIGDKGTRRNFREIVYRATPCAYYPSCPRGNHCCGFAHGNFERQYHPMKFRTNMCKYGMLCTTKACPNAHHRFELRQPSPFPTTILPFHQLNKPIGIQHPTFANQLPRPKSSAFNSSVMGSCNERIYQRRGGRDASIGSGSERLVEPNSDDQAMADQGQYPSFSDGKKPATGGSQPKS